MNVASDTAPWLAEFTIAEGAFNSGDFVCVTDRGVEVDAVYTEGGTCHADRKRGGLPYQVEGVRPLVEKIFADAPCPNVNFCKAQRLPGGQHRGQYHASQCQQCGRGAVEISIHRLTGYPHL